MYNIIYMYKYNVIIIGEESLFLFVYLYLRVVSFFCKVWKPVRLDSASNPPTAYARDSRERDTLFFINSFV